MDTEGAPRFSSFKVQGRPRSRGYGSVGELLKPLFEEIDGCDDAIAQLHAEWRAFERRKTEAVREFLESAPEDLRPQLAAVIYYEVREVPTGAIAEFFDVRPSRLHAMLPPQQVATCQCGRAITVRSRTQYDAFFNRRSGFPAESLCAECWAQLAAGRQAEWSARQREWDVRQAAMRALPYREYLLTPEWNERRQRMLKVARYRCQVCNAGGRQLNVHHRTYRNRGNETRAI